MAIQLLFCGVLPPGLVKYSSQTDKIKRNFIQPAVVSILVYGCTSWILTKRMEKKLDGNYTRMLQAIDLSLKIVLWRMGRK